MNTKWFDVNTHFAINLEKVQVEMCFKDFRQNPPQDSVKLTNGWEQPIYETRQEFQARYSQAMQE